MSYKFHSLGPDRYLVWDLLRETDPYYLNHHLFDADFFAIAEDRKKREAAGQPVPSYVAYSLWAYSRALHQFPELNSYLRLWPLTKLAVYDGVDISLTIERHWNHRRIILLALLKEAQTKSIEQIHEFLCQKRDAPIESLEEFENYKRLLKIPAFCRWHLFQLFIKPFPSLMRPLVGTTAFTSIGRFGSTLTTPLSPRTCTMSLGQVQLRPRALKTGDLVARPSAWLTLTYDHRVADGADIARMGTILKTLLETLEEPVVEHP